MEREAGAPRLEPPFALSVDVEDYFQVQAFARRVSRDRWDEYPSRVERNTHRLLDLFDARGATATFFTLGWVARRFPALVREIHTRGHEVASHGTWHRMITEQTPEEFRRDVTESRALLEDACGTEVIGYRAPSYSIGARTLWALDLLVEAGYRYDSSIYPIRRLRYGYPEGPVVPTTLHTADHSIVEFPLSTLRLAGVRVPVLAGAYLRLWPVRISVVALRRHRAAGLPVVVNVHPWELDPGQPTIGPARWRTWTHYARLASMERILDRVLAEGRFVTVAAALEKLGLLAGAEQREIAR